MPESIWTQTLALADIITLHREEIARLRRLPDVVAQAFVDHDIYRLLLPADLGGAGLNPMQQFDLVEEISSRDASAGWNYAVGSGLGLFSGFLPRHQAEAMFTRQGSVMAGSGAPQGKAHRVEGGYRIEGRFGWASGIDQAHWVYGGCLVHENGNLVINEAGRPGYVLAFAPKSQAVVHECWNVGGLVATNSTEFSLTDVFVPHDRAIIVPWEKYYHPSPLFRLPRTFFGYALTAVPLGVARNVINGLRDLGLSKSAPGRGRLADSGFAQYAVAKAEALVEAGLLSARHSFHELWRAAVAGEEASMEACARVRRACVHAAESSLEAANLCYRAAGGSALFASAPFEAGVRDISAMLGHLVFQRTMMEDAGRVAFGLDPVLPNF